VTTAGAASLAGTALNAGSFTIGALSYNYRSALKTYSGGAGSATYQLAMSDNAGNSATSTSYSVTVDGTAPAATDVQTTNKAGGTVGRAEAGDKVTYSFSEPIDPVSILAGWDGSASSVTVRLTDNASNDSLTVFNGASQLPLGSVALNGNYAGATRDFPASSMVRTGNTIAITLGTPSGGTVTAGANTTMSWAVAAGPYDRAGNALPPATVTESGAADKEF
jgi:hypothetical protein